MPTELLGLCRALLASDDITAALTKFSAQAPDAKIELWDAGGLVARYGPDLEEDHESSGETRFNGSLWSGICRVPESKKILLEVWLLLMEQFDRRTAEAWTDPLTGLPNRRWLAFELERRPPALVGFFDLVGLQSTNREQGHRAGDERLRTAAASLMALGGRAFRVGGDEFVVLLAEPPADIATIPDGLHGGWGSTLAEAEQRSSSPRP